MAISKDVKAISVANVRAAADKAQRDAVGAAIAKVNSGLARRTLNVVADIQHAALAACVFYATSDEFETCYLTSLYNAVDNSKGYNVKKLKGYIMNACPQLEYKKDAKGNFIFHHPSRLRGDADARDCDAMLVTLGEMTWVDFKPPTAEQPFDLTKLATSFVKSVYNKADNAGRSITPEQLSAALAAAIQALEPNKVTTVKPA